ncbi:aromatic motif membrane protein [Candidatus Mycoplasma pogonae]
MKKLLKKASLFGLSIFGSITLVSCGQNYEDNDKKSDVSVLLKPRRDFSADKQIEKLLKLLFKDNINAEKNYLFTQNTQPATNLIEVQHSLIWNDFLISSASLNSSITKNSIAKIKAADKLFFTLSNDWYWYLKNINKMFFILNTYSITSNSFWDFGFGSNEEIIDLLKDNQNSLLKKIPENKIQEMYFIDIPNQKGDIYTHKQAIYLRYTKNIFIKIMYVIKNNQPKIFVWPDLFVIDNRENFQDLFTELEKNIITERNYEINYQLRKDSYLDEPFDIPYNDQIYQIYNDSNYFENFSKAIIQPMIKDAIKKINAKNEAKITRYILRSTDEI